MTAGLAGKIMGLIFITREGEEVGVGFLSQIPWGLEIQEGVNTGSPGAQGKEKRGMRSKGSAWAASWVAHERERQTKIQRERLEARAE